MIPNPWLGLHRMPPEAMKQVHNAFIDGQFKASNDLDKLGSGVFSSGKPSVGMLDYVMSHLDVILSYDHKLRIKEVIPFDSITTTLESVALLSMFGGNLVLAATRELVSGDFAQQVFRDQSKFEMQRVAVREFQKTFDDNWLLLLRDVLAVDVARQRKRRVTTEEAVRHTECVGALNHLNGECVVQLLRVLASRQDLWRPLFEIHPADNVPTAQAAVA